VFHFTAVKATAIALSRWAKKRAILRPDRWQRPPGRNLSVNLREQVEALLPGWESWYPSLFDAAVDLGVIKAQVCSPSQLLLSRRHSAVQSAATQAHREQWGGVLQDIATPLPQKNTSDRATPRRRKRRRGRGGGKKGSSA
jgi:hypothetical protein